MEQPGGGERRRGRNRVDLVQKLPHLADERIALVAPVEEGESAQALVLVEVAAGGFLEQVERVRERLGLCQLLVGEQHPRREPDDDQGDVDESEGRPEEVVVVARHELADLVDEEPKAHSTENGRHPA